MITLDHARDVAVTRRDYCSHTRTRVEISPPGHKHYGRVICVDCGKFLCWQPNPRNVELRQRNAINLRKLLDSGRLSPWEDGFCQGISQTPRLSPRQQALLNSLIEKHLTKGDSTSNADYQRNGNVSR
jgi:hypothetical protein